MGFNQISFPQVTAISARSLLNYKMFLLMDGLLLEATFL